MYGKTPYAFGMRQAVKGSSGKARRPKRPSVPRKVARMELRLTATSKTVIERASSISGLTPGDLAYEAARRIVEDHERFVLREEDREVFFKALENPPTPTSALIKAAKRHRTATR